MVPTVAAEIKLCLPHYVKTLSFVQMKGLSACQKLRLGSHVNSIATVRSLPIFDPFYLYFCHLDSCQGPEDSKELKETTGLGRNVNGSVCLNFVCQCVFWTPDYTDVTHLSQLCECFRWFSM